MINRGRTGGLMRNDYRVKHKNYDFALSRNNKRYAEQQRRMNQPRKYRPMKNKYGAVSNAYRKIKSVAAVENNEAVAVMSMTSTSIRNIEPSVNVRVSEIDGVINSLNKMRGDASINPPVNTLRPPVRVSYKKGARARAVMNRANRRGHKPIATIYMRKGAVVKVEPGTNKIYTGPRMSRNLSGYNRTNRMNRTTGTRINRMPAISNPIPHYPQANSYQTPAPVIYPNSFRNVIKPDINSPVYRNSGPLNHAPFAPPAPVRRIMDATVKQK
jgi:hypothetical protein